MRAIIAAVSPEGVIGVGGTLPWHYAADLQRFRRLTLGATVLMGRHTWESLPKRPLPGRRNIVITSHPVGGAACYASLAVALAACSGDVWFIGGARLFAEALHYADLIDLTYVPDRIAAADAVYFPPIDLATWRAGPRLPYDDDPRLTYCQYRRRGA